MLSAKKVFNYNAENDVQLSNKKMFNPAWKAQLDRFFAFG